MKLTAHFITYRSCPIEIREKLVFSKPEQKKILHKLHVHQDISEAALLQTCNRLEFYLYTKKDFDCSACLLQLLSDFSPQSAVIWQDHQKELQGPDAVRHLFEVSAGLDSQMVGENQILAQLRSAYSLSTLCRTSKIIFHRLFHLAFRAGKAVRTNTDINCGAVSISLAAVERASKKIDLKNSSAMLVGAGENAEIVAKYLVKAPVKKLIIANRNLQKAKQLAETLNASEAIELGRIPQAMEDVDLLICSTASEKPVITLNNIQARLKTRKDPLLIIDIAVPRDVEESVSKFGCVTLVNIDDLDEQIQANRKKRNSEIPKAQKIVYQFQQQFLSWYESLNLVPLITKLTQKAVDIADAEARRYASDFSTADRRQLKVFAESLAKKLLHGPISYLKCDSEDEASNEKLIAADLVNKMFLSDQDQDKE